MILHISIAVFFFIVLLHGLVILRMKREAKKREGLLSTLDKVRIDNVNARKESTTDQLTGFNNRRAYEIDFSNIKKNGFPENFSIITIDINELKATNDSLGHYAGDELIKGACECLNTCFGADGKIYRIGGDEFVVFLELPKDKTEELMILLNRIAQSWRGSLVKELTMSCGWVFQNDYPEMNLVELEKLADKRMYDQKSVFYSTKRNRRGAQDIALKSLEQTYIKILSVDLQNDTFHAIKMEDSERTVAKGFSTCFSKWLHDFGTTGNVLQDDLEIYLEKVELSFLSDRFKKDKSSLRFCYGRKINNDFKKVMMEILPAPDYTDEKQSLFLYVKEIDQQD